MEEKYTKNPGVTMVLRLAYAICVLMYVGLDVYSGPSVGLGTGSDSAVCGEEGLAATDGTVRIPFGVREVGAESFRERRRITGVEIAESVGEIHNAAFANCVRLRDVVVPRSVKNIGSSAFMNCNSLTSLVIKSAIPVLRKSTCERCWRLEKIELPETLAGIGDSCFRGDFSLRKVVLPQSVKTIGSRAFAGCSRLREVQFPDVMESVGEYAFANCGSLRYVELPRRIRRLGKGVFEGCHSLKGVVVTGAPPVADVDLLRSASDSVKIYLVAADAESATDRSGGMSWMRGYDVVICCDVDEARRIISMSDGESAQTKELKRVLCLAIDGFASRLPEVTVDLPGLSELAANIEEFCSLTNDVSVDKWYARHPIRVTAERDKDGRCSAVTAGFGRYEGMSVSFEMNVKDGSYTLSEGLKKGLVLGLEMRGEETEYDFSTWL